MKFSKEEKQKFTKVEQLANRKNGITLVALVVTVVVLLILAGITIMYVMGDNGVFGKAKNAKDKTEQAKQDEQDYLNNVNNTIDKYVDGNGGKPKDPPKEETIDTATSYVGYYADMEGDGVVDGIIYADLAKGKTATGNWGNSNGAYEIEAVTTGLKEYTISNKTYTGQTKPGIYKANDGFGEKQVITPVKESSGTERFYIMALEDVQLAHPYSETSNTAYWYYNANGKMSDYATYTSTSFGKGKENTKKMIARWKKTNTTEVPNATEVDYGAQNEKDLWGQIDTEVAKGWYVPSKEEWSAFGKELGIKGAEDSEGLNYAKLGLSDWYWSSSPNGTGSVYFVTFDGGCIGMAGVGNYFYVRLCATF